MIVDNDDLRTFQTSIRSYLADNYSANQLRSLIKGDGAFDSKKWKEFVELGALSFFAPERLGGGCLSDNRYLDAAIVAYELGRVLYDGPFLASSIAVQAMGSQQSEHFDDVIEAVMAGEKVVAWAFEDNDDRNSSVMTSNNALHAKKKLVEFGNEATSVLVSTSTDGIGQLSLVENTNDAIKIYQRESLDPTRRFVTMEINNVTASSMPADIDRLLALSILLQSAETLGLVDYVFDMTLDWVNSRIAFGRPIGSYQALKHRLAEHKLWLESSRGMVEGLAIALNEDSGYQEMASATKAFIGNGSVTFVQDAIQMHGGIALTWEHDLHLYLRRATSNRVQFGSPSKHLEKLSTLIGV